MSTTETFRLKDAAREVQAGTGVGFGIRGGVQIYNRQTKQKEWTNYEAFVFSNNPAQQQFYRDALVPGSIVTVTGTGLLVKQFEGKNGTVTTLEIQDAKFQAVFSGDAPQQPQQRQAPQQAQQQYRQPNNYQGSMQQQAAQAANNQIDSDIPF